MDRVQELEAIVERQRLEIQELRAKLGLPAAASGESTTSSSSPGLSEEDMAPVPSPATSFSLKGAWAGASAGGCLNFDTWRNNPQFFLTIPSEANVTVRLIQNGTEHPIGMYLAQGDGSGRVLLGEPQIVGKTPFAVQPECVHTFPLPACDASLAFVLVPCTFHQNLEGSFSLEISSDVPIVAEAAVGRRRWHRAAVTGEWAGESAGGCKNHPSFVSNPQYALKLPQASRVVILLSQSAKSENDFDALGLYLIRYSGKTKMVECALSQVIGRSDFSFSTNGTLIVDRLEAGEYTIVPCTFDPGHSAPFSLQVCASEPGAQLSELFSQAGVTLKSEWGIDTAGGCMNHSTWRKNPQFRVTAQEDCEISVRLQHYSAEPDVSIGFYLVRSRGGRRTVRVTKEERVAQSGFVVSRAVALKVQLKAADGPFVLIPSTFLPNRRCSFDLSVYGSVDVTPIPAGDLHEAVVASEWRGATAGGALSNPTWRMNPQFALSSPSGQDATAYILLQKPAVSAALYVFDADGPTRVFRRALETEVLTKSKFNSADWIVEVPMRAGRHYACVPAALRPGTEGAFTLTAYSAVPLVWTSLPFPAFPALRCAGRWAGESAGGSVSHKDTWMQNPHFSLRVLRPTRVGVLLYRTDVKAGSEDLPYLGFDLSQGDQWGYPRLASQKDMVQRALYEPERDVYAELDLVPSEHPYVITPSLEDAGVTGEFALQVMADDPAAVRVARQGELMTEEEEREMLRLWAEAEHMQLDDDDEDDDELLPPGAAPRPPGDAPLPPPDDDDDDAPAPPALLAPIYPSAPTRSAPRAAPPTCPHCGGEISSASPATSHSISHSAAPSAPPAPAGGPAPPPPPAPAAVPSAPPVAPASGLGGALGAVRLKKAAGKEGKSPRPAQNEDKLGDLLDSIRSGMVLKKAAERKLAPPPPKELNVTFNVDKILARRKAMISDGESDDEDNDEWMK